MSETSTVAAFLAERHPRIAAELDLFVGKRIAPLAAPEDDDAARFQSRKILAELGKWGVISHVVPRTYGGKLTAPDLRACCLVREALAAASPLADAVFALQCLGSLPITLFGTVSQRRRWLPAVCEGRAMAAFAMTEAGAGSDVSGIRTEAERKGSDYILNGTKILISNAGIADLYTVFASTDLHAGNKGLSCFVVPARARGLRFLGPQVMSAPHPLGKIEFDNCRVPSDARLGREGDGFKIGMATLDRLRATVGAAACGMAERALREAIAHAKARRQFGKPLAEMQLIQERIAVMATELAAARLLVYRAAWEKDRGKDRVTVESAMAKAYATEAAQRIVDGAVQILGGAGVMADHPVDRLYRAVRALRIYEGTTEIQHLVIAGHLLKG